MLSTLHDLLDRWLGLSLESHDLHFSHMAWRALIVFVFAVLLLRLGDRRFLGRNAGYDWMLGVILGSVLSRGINGQAAFFPTLGVSAVLVLLHHLLSVAAFHSHAVSSLAKGQPIVLVREGKRDRAAMRHCKITDDDLDENLRLNGNEQDTGDIAEARLERNGSVSVVKAKGK